MTIIVPEEYVSSRDQKGNTLFQKRDEKKQKNFQAFHKFQKELKGGLGGRGYQIF